MAENGEGGEAIMPMIDEKDVYSPYKIRINYTEKEITIKYNDSFIRDSKTFKRSLYSLIRDLTKCLTRDEILINRNRTNDRLRNV